MHLRPLVVVAAAWLGSALVSRADDPPSPVQVERAGKIAAGLGLTDPAQAARVRDLIAKQYRDLSRIHEARDAALKAAPGAEAAKDTASARMADLHYAYLAGNQVIGNDRVTRDNWDGGVQPDVQQKPLAEVISAIRSDKPTPHNSLTIHSAAESYEAVLARAGAILPVRDAVDRRVVEMVRSGKVGDARATPEDSALVAAADYAERWVKELEDAVTKGFISNPAQVGGYPDYKGEPYTDTDGDGLPDAWETAHGLDPKDAADALADLNGDGYTNIEDFINGLDPRAAKTDWSDLKNNIDPRNPR